MNKHLNGTIEEAGQVAKSQTTNEDDAAGKTISTRKLITLPRKTGVVFTVVHASIHHAGVASPKQFRLEETSRKGSVTDGIRQKTEAAHIVHNEKVSDMQNPS